MLSSSPPFTLSKDDLSDPKLQRLNRLFSLLWDQVNTAANNPQGVQLPAATVALLPSAQKNPYVAFWATDGAATNPITVASTPAAGGCIAFSNGKVWVGII